MTELLRRLSRLMLPLAALYCGPAASGEMLHHRSPHPLAALLLADGRVIAKLETPGGVGFFALSLHGDSTKLSRLPGYLPTPLEEQADMLPDGIVTKGKRDIAAAWLTGPTKRYDHGVLGDAIEASGLRVRLRDGSELSYLLSDDSVFEDRQVRLADLDGDGGDELVVVRSYPTAGAALAVFRPQGGEIVKVAETKPIGQPHRWLNPAAIADFDGDGYLEVAAVVTPHIGGTLIMLELRLNRLRLQWLHKKWSARGFFRIMPSAAVFRTWPRRWTGVVIGAGGLFCICPMPVGAPCARFFSPMAPIGCVICRAISGQLSPLFTRLIWTEMAGKRWFTDWTVGNW
jgi:hypothetical protein